MGFDMGFPRHITLIFNIVDHEDDIVNEIYGSKITISTIATKDGSYDLNSLRDSVEHELTHFMQNMIAAYVSITKKIDYKKTHNVKPGFPKEWDKAEGREQKNPEYKKYKDYYFSSGVEFFPV
jgi:hypothetical protein